MFKTRKIAIIGAGHVGSHCALSLITQGACDELVLIDTDEKKAIAHAADLEDSICCLPHRVRISAGTMADCAGADIAVMSAGAPRLENQTRLDVMGATVEILKTIVSPLVRSGFDGILISISNPADVIAHYLMEKTRFPAHRVLSTGAMLDSARLIKFLAQETGVSHKSICAFVMGEHGDSQMVLWSAASIGGKPLTALMRENPETYGRLDLSAIAQCAKTEGGRILSGKGFTEFGIGTALCELVKTIFHDENRVLPVSVLLSGQYGQRSVYASVPAFVGKDGVNEVLELSLTETEQQAFDRSCAVIRENQRLALAL